MNYLDYGRLIPQAKLGGIALVLCWVLMLLVGCGQPSGDDAKRRLYELDARINELSAEIEALKKSNEELKDRVFWREFFSDADKVAFLKPADEGYATVGFDLGVLTVKLIDVREYANGAKVELRFGNTLSSSINGLKATIEWGSLDNKGLIIENNKKTKEIELNETLYGGKWTTISIVLDGVPPNDLGFVRLSKISHGGISLGR